MLNIQLLEEDDVFLSTDWCRPMVLMPDSSQSDNYSFTSCYGGSPINNLKWIKVGDIIRWSGTVREYNERCFSYPYEFVRGDIPTAHQIKS